MPSCRRVRAELTSWLDGEGSGGGRQRLEAHLDRCPSCRLQADRLRSSVEGQRELLMDLMTESVSDRSRMLAEIRRRALAKQPPARLSWAARLAWILRPIPVAVAVAAGLTITLVEVAGGPDDVLVPMGVKAPPPAVSRKPVMFRDYAILEKLEALENFDTVEVEPLEDDGQEGQG